METAYTDRLRKVEQQTRELLTKLPENLFYHNAEHTLHPELGVASVANKLSLLEGISYGQRELIVTAAYFHDVGYLEQQTKNEVIGARIAGEILPALGYNGIEIASVKEIILATEVPTNPKNHLEEIICDADVDNLGREDFFALNEALRREIGVEDKLVWYKNSIRFLEGHTYYTTAARSSRNERKAQNLQMLYKLVGGRSYE